jgi:hypothetical protein
VCFKLPYDGHRCVPFVLRGVLNVRLLSSEIVSFFLHVVTGYIMKYLDTETATAHLNNVGALGMFRT